MSTAEQKRKRRAEKRPAKIVTEEGIVWSLVVPGWAQEPVLTVGRQEVMQAVDTSVYCYKMHCGCGRHRYVRPNSVFEVIRCRVCQKMDRVLRRKKKEKEMQQKQERRGAA